MKPLKDRYHYPPQQFRSADGHISATVYRPILEPEERRRREERIKRAAENILRPILFPEVYGRKETDEDGNTK